MITLAAPPLFSQLKMPLLPPPPRPGTSAAPLNWPAPVSPMNVVPAAPAPTYPPPVAKKSRRRCCAVAFDGQLPLDTYTRS